MEISSIINWTSTYQIHGSLGSISYLLQKVSEYNHEISQSHTADQPTGSRDEATEHL